MKRTIEVFKTELLERLVEGFLDFTVVSRPELTGDEELVSRNTCTANTFAYGLFVSVSPVPNFMNMTVRLRCDKICSTMTYQAQSICL